MWFDGHLRYLDNYLHLLTGCPALVYVGITLRDINHVSEHHYVEAPHLFC